MARVDLETRLKQLDVQQVSANLWEWLQLPSVYYLTPESRQQVAQVLLPPHRPGGARGFINWEKRRVLQLIEKGQYQWALDITTRSVAGSEGRFPEAEVPSIHYHARALRGAIFEHLVSRGPYKKHPLKYNLFLMAANAYMDADREIGVVTPLAQKVAQCALGAGEQRMGYLALGNLYPNHPILFVGAEGRKELEALATESKIVGSVPFGGRVREMHFPKPPLSVLGSTTVFVSSGFIRE